MIDTTNGAMRLTLQAVVVSALLASLLTWLMINGQPEMDAVYAHTQRMIDGLALAESRMQHDVLRARTGLLRNYDPINVHIEKMQAQLLELRMASATAPKEIHELSYAVDQEIQMVERFKTCNALVQASLINVQSLGDALSQSDINPAFMHTIAVLQIQVGELDHDMSIDHLNNVRSRLDMLAAATYKADIQDKIDAVVLHGRQLLNELPRLDKLTLSLTTSSSAAARQALSEAHRVLRDQREARSNLFRLALYAAAMTLLVLMLRIGLLMHASAIVLQRTIAFQAAVAHAANRFLASQPDEISASITEVLAIVGEAARTDNGYVLMLDESETIFYWSRSGDGNLDDWPHKCRLLIQDIDKESEEQLFITTASSNGPPLLIEALKNRGVTTFTCARLKRNGQLVGILCFERTTSLAPAWLLHSRGLLQVVADSFAAALERQQACAERAEIEEALRRAQRLEAIGTFASGVAHNFNNVLNVMLGHAEIAIEALPGRPTRAANQIEMLVQAGGRAREIAGQILDYGRRGSGADRISAVDAIVAETFDQIRSSCPEAGALRLIGLTEGANVGGEPAQLQQVIHNLVRNALQASDPDQPIEVRLDRIKLGDPQELSHGSLRPGEYARISVSDIGRGMDDATLRRVFEPFFTTRSMGTGLGLATAYEFVDEQRGAFHVCSMLGAGSTFEVWLPVRTQFDTRLSTATGTVMVVGNDRNSMLEDEEILASLGLEPVGYSNLDIALKALRDDPGRFNLLILENFRSMSLSLDFARNATRMVNIPIVLSISASEQIRPEILSSIPIVDILRRPWRPRDIAQTIRRHII